jgi:hypothetical protein
LQLGEILRLFYVASGASFVTMSSRMVFEATFGSEGP